MPEADPATVVEWAERILLNDYQMGREHIMVKPVAMARLVAIARLGLAPAQSTTLSGDH